MTTTLPTVLISGASEELTARIEHLVRGQAELSLVKTVVPEDAVNATFKAKLIWIELESDPEGNVALLDHLIKSHPNTFFVVSKEDLEPDLVKRTMQIGALDFLDHKGWAAQIRSVVRRIMAKEFGSKPTPGSPMASASRQPQRPSSWGSLNSLKVTVPPNSGFKRVEPGKTAPAQPGKPADSVPQMPTPAAPPATPVKSAPPASPEPAQVEEVEVEEELTYAEEGEQGGFDEAEPEVEAEVEAEAEPEVEAEGDAGYSDGEPEGEIGYAEAEGDLPQGDAETEPQAQVEFANEEDGSAVEPTEEETVDGVEAESLEDEEPLAASSEEENLEEVAEEEVAEEQEPKQSPSAPAIKGRWDDLDSIISTTGKPEEKKTSSKWGELGNIQTSKPASKEAPAAPSTSSKWSDLDAIGGSSKPSTTPETSAAKSASKWGDLDALAGKSATPAAGNKWGDLDGLGSKGSEPVAPSANKWGDLDSVGAKPADPEPEPEAPPAGNKWGDLDAISGGGTKNLEQERPPGGGASGKKWGDLDALGTAPKEPVSDAGKWGNLDALGTKSTGAPKSHTKSFIKPKAQPDAAAAAKAKWGDLAATDPGADPEPAAAAAGNKWGNLDTIGGGMAKSPPLDSPNTVAGSADQKWGDLNSIRTPKSGQEASANWGDLSAIPTPAAPEAPALIEGSLPSALVSNDASQKWKAGMSSDISTGARQVGEMRDKLKEKGQKVTVKVGWEKVSILVAAAIVASAGFLSYSFFTYPVPPADKIMK